MYSGRHYNVCAWLLWKRLGDPYSQWNALTSLSPGPFPHFSEPKRDWRWHIHLHPFFLKDRFVIALSNDKCGVWPCLTTCRSYSSNALRTAMECPKLLYNRFCEYLFWQLATFSKPILAKYTSLNFSKRVVYLDNRFMKIWAASKGLAQDGCQNVGSDHVNLLFLFSLSSFFLHIPNLPMYYDDRRATT